MGVTPITKIQSVDKVVMYCTANNGDKTEFTFNKVSNAAVETTYNTIGGMCCLTPYGNGEENKVSFDAGLMSYRVVQKEQDSEEQKIEKEEQKFEGISW